MYNRQAESHMYSAMSTNTMRYIVKKNNNNNRQINRKIKKILYTYKNPQL